MGKWQHRAIEPRYAVVDGEPSKRCPACGGMKSMNTGFHRNRATKDGCACYCRSCTPSIVAPSINREKARAVAASKWAILRSDPDYWRRKREYYARVLAPRYRDDLAERQKAAARCTVYAAIRARVLTKPSTCSACAVSATGHALQAHHHDYSKPLEVQWLCTKCHGKTHRKYGHQSLSPRPAGQKLSGDNQGHRGPALPDRLRASQQSEPQVPGKALVPVSS